MGRDKPDIYLGNTTRSRDRNSFKEFVIEIIEDTYINDFKPTSISLDGELFTLYLDGIRFAYEDLPVGEEEDYMDVYLYGVRQSDESYSATHTTESVTIEFNEPITRVPEDVEKDDFTVRGKLVETN